MKWELCTGGSSFNLLTSEIKVNERSNYEIGVFYQLTVPTEALRARVLIFARFCSLMSARSLAALTLFWVCLYLEDVEEERLKKDSNSSYNSILGKVQGRNLFSLFNLLLVGLDLPLQLVDQGLHALVVPDK